MDNSLANLIATIAGALITVALAYLPGLAQRWETLDGSQKRAVLGALYLAVSAGLYAPACLGGPAVVECDVSSVWDVVMAFFLALMAGQGLYTALPSSKKDK